MLLHQSAGELRSRGCSHSTAGLKAEIHLQGFRFEQDVQSTALPSVLTASGCAVGSLWTWHSHGIAMDALPCGFPWMHSQWIPRDAFPGTSQPAGAAWAQLSLAWVANRLILHWQPWPFSVGHSLGSAELTYDILSLFHSPFSLPFILSHEFLWLFQRNDSSQAGTR